MRKTAALFLAVFIFASSLDCHAAHSHAPALALSDEAVTVIVQLSGDAVLEEQTAIRDGAKKYLTTNSAKQTERRILTQQSAVKSEIRSIIGNADTNGYAYTHILNGFTMRAKRSDIPMIAALNGVAAVFESESGDTGAPAVASAYESAVYSNEVSGAYYMQRSGYDGRGTVIAVIDAEFDCSHEFLNTDILSPKLSKADISALSDKLNANTDTDALYHSQKIPYAFNYGTKTGNTYVSGMSHGTHIAGIAAGKNGKAPDGSLFNGTAPEAQLLLMAVPDLKTADVIAAWDDAVKLGADVINASWGVPRTVRSIYNECLENSVNAGIIVSAAAGNESNKITDMPLYTDMPDHAPIDDPAGSHGCMAVASAKYDPDSGISLTDNSSWGPSATLELKPDITALGYNIYSSAPNDTYKYLSGTSASAPQYSGCAAILKQYLETNYNISGDKTAIINSLLMTSADIIRVNDTPLSPRAQGAGIINMEKAIKTPIILTGDSARAKLSLYDGLSDSFDITFTAYNFTDTPAVYDDIDVCVQTDGHDGNMIKGTQSLSAAFDLPECVAVPAGEAVQINGRITLDPAETAQLSSVFKNGFFVEGYIILNGSELPEASLPFMGFYGDWTAQNTAVGKYFDAQPFCGNRLAAYNGQELDTLGIYEDTDGSIFGAEEYVGISPDGDGIYDLIYPLIRTSRAFSDINIYFEYNGEKRVLTSSPGLQSGVEYLYKPDDNTLFYDIPDGNYTLTAEIRPIYNAAVTEKQCFSFYIDREKPESEKIYIENDDLVIKASDNRQLKFCRLIGEDADGEPWTAQQYFGGGTNAELRFDITNIPPESITAEVWDFAGNFSSSRAVSLVIEGISHDGGSLSAEIKNLCESPVTADIVFCAYDENGGLKDISITKNAVFGTGINRFDAVLDGSDNTAVYVFGSLDKMDIICGLNTAEQLMPTSLSVYDPDGRGTNAVFDNDGIAVKIISDKILQDDELYYCIKKYSDTVYDTSEYLAFGTVSAADGGAFFSLPCPSDPQNGPYILRVCSKKTSFPTEVYVLSRSSDVHISGDVNGDNIVNNSDTALVLSYLIGSGRLSPAQINAANTSGGLLLLDLTDAVGIERIAGRQ